MNKIWFFFLEKKQFTYLLIAGILIFGFLAYLSIPKESSPEVKIPVGIVTTIYPGASASDVEKLVTDKIEDGLNNLSGLNKLTSTSRESVSIVTAEFEANADLDKSIQDLKSEVDKIKPELPEEANDPAVSEINFADQPIFIISISSELPPTEFSDLAENVKDELRSVSGVSRIEIGGSRAKQVQVIADKGKLALYNVSLGQVIAAVSGMNAAAPVGDITVDGVKYNLKFQGDITDPEVIKNLPVASRNGTPVFLRELANVYNGVAEPSSFSRFSVEGEPANQSITLSVFKKSGGDITEIGDEIKSRIETLKSGLLKDAEVLISFDQSKMIKDDLNHLLRSGFETIALIMIVLFITIGWRESFIAGLSVPLSFLIAFIGLQYSGNTINFISLFSLILAIGILVDSGIVVVESIYTRYKKHHDKERAAKETIEEYGWPLIAGTMTTIAVFIPLFFISGIVGKFIASIPYTTIFVLLASIFVALALVPILTIKVVKEGHSSLEEKQNAYTLRFQNWYREKLQGIIGNRKRENKFMGLLIGLFFLSFLLPITGLVKVVFFPQEDSDFIYLDLEKSKGTPLEETDMAVRGVEELLYDDPRIESFITAVGSGSSFGSGGSGSNLANITLNLREDRSENSTEILESLKKKLEPIKTIQVKAMEPNSGPPVGAPIAIKLTGENLEDLDKASVEVERVLSTIKGTREITSSTKDDLPDFVLALNRDRASEFGLNAASVAQILRSSVYGVTATKVRSGGDDIEVVVKVNLNPNDKYGLKSSQTVLESINQLPVDTPSGQILLGSILDSSLKKGRSSITHEDNKRLVTVSGYLNEDITSAEVLSQFNKKQETLKLPEGVTLSTGGETEEMQKTFKEMFYALLGGLVLMLIILVLEFNSLRYAMYVLAIVPLSLTGVFLGLALSRQALSFPSILGFIALAGVIVNHTILLIDSIDRLRKKDPNRNIRELVIEAATVRLRPIILTTITTVMGMVPLIFVSSIWGPLAFTVMFGLSFSLLLTLGFVPVLVSRWPGRLSTSSVPSSSSLPVPIDNNHSEA